MRELKFRAYIKPLKRYATGLDTIQFHKCCDVAGAGIWTVVTVNEGIFEGDDIVLEQDTGLKDKNRKSICEGDILNDGVGHIGEVLFNERIGAFVYEWGDCGSMFIDLYTSDIEVVGNIHENPELLKGEE